MKIIERVNLSLKSNCYHYSKGVINELAKVKAKHLKSVDGVAGFWWSDILNFGDLFTPDIIKAFGYEPIKTTAQQSKIVGVGSIIGAVPDSYNGVILGSGIISPKSEKKLPDATFAAIRGELTKKVMGLSSNVPTGDFGILASKLYRTKTKRYKLGIVPHYVDRFNPWVYQINKQFGDSCCIIDVQGSARRVSEQISECEMIISSSMHGIIVADSYNIPNVWIQLSDKVIGNGFKFHDYNTSLDFEQKCHVIKSSRDDLDIEKVATIKSSVTIEKKINELWGIAEQELAQLENY